MLRWFLLSQSCGIWSDIDMLYINPVREYKQPFAAGVPIVFTRPNQPLYFTIGFLMSRQPDNIFKTAFDASVKIVDTNSSLSYQSLGSCLLADCICPRLFERLKTGNKEILAQTLQYFQQSIKQHQVFCIPTTDVLPILSQGQLIIEMISKPIYDMSFNFIGLHWFGGHPRISSSLENDILNKQSFYENKQLQLTFFGKTLNRYLMDNRNSYK
jgi:hypothetical protein